MPKKRKQNPIRCFNCNKPLDPSGKLRKLGRYYIYCRACFGEIAFKCCRCGGNYPHNRRAANQRTCLACAGCTQTDNQDANWHAKRLSTETTFDKIKSKRRYGVEIETAQCKYVCRVQGTTPFGAKYDGTISGKEFDSPILAGDEGLAVIRDFCDIAKRRAWTVDERCGTHIHLDMSSQTSASLRQTAVGYLHTYQSWSKLVDPSRLGNEFCMPPTYNVSAVTASVYFSSFTETRRRYEFINFRAFERHGTFEIRGLEGTLDKNLLVNWIIAHLTFVDFCAKVSIEELEKLFNQPESICWANLKTVLGDTARYFGRRRENNK